MVKRLTIIIALVIVLAVPSISTAFGNYFGKSLCDFPFGTYGTFSVYFDQRLYDPDYYTGSYPNGGIKFELMLGLFDSAEARDDLISQIYWIQYTNKSTGSTYIVKTASKYLYIDGRSAGEYSIWHGNRNAALGVWVVRVITKTGIYRGSFTITQEMVDQIPPIAVEPFIMPDIEGFISITAEYTNGDDYRFRVIDSEGNFTDEIRFPPDQCVAPPCIYIEQYPATGDMFRIETRIRDQAWPLMIPGDECVAYGMNPGNFSRSSIWLKLELPPEPLP